VLRRVNSLPGSLRIVLACACIWLGGFAGVGSVPSAQSAAVASASLRSADAPRAYTKRASVEPDSWSPPRVSWPVVAAHTLEPPAANPVRELVPDLYLRKRVLLR